ncbi:MAG: GGDEF domain-containing response regulator [Lachnospiraceae bacterium]|nr:GGDEF domain-containing response regulator [Lachnospiraceae bacterium]
MEKRILIVDDNIIDLTFVKKVLSLNEMYCIDTISSGREVLSNVKDNVPDLLILNVTENDKGNLAVIESVRLRTALNRMPVIVFTETYNDEIEEKSFELGAFDCIAHPEKCISLKMRIEKALDYGDGEIFREASEKDYLTGIYNRRFAEREITKLVKLGRGTFFLLDVDNFKQINDVFGHSMGDQVLKISADLIKENIMAEDILFRLGGDEFGIYAPGIETVGRAREYAFSLINAYAKKKEEYIYMKKASLSVGATIIAETDETFEDVYLKADKALYFVKQNGRNSFYCYSGNDDEQKRLSALGRKTELQRFAELLMNYRKKNGVFEVGYREFENVFELASRFTKRNEQKMQIVLFTLVSVDDEDEMDQLMIEDTVALLGDTISKTLRAVDICVRFSSKQYLVALVDTEKEYIDVVTDRVMQEFYKLYKGKEYIVTYDMADID